MSWVSSLNHLFMKVGEAQPSKRMALRARVSSNCSALAAWNEPINAIYGLSDTLVLAARDIAQTRGLIDEHTLIVGTNGDPLALSSIADGTMTATIDTPAAAFGRQAVDVACAAAHGATLPAHLSYEPHLVTAQNVAEVAMQKLIAIADLPSRLVGVNREQEQQRLVQLEVSQEINRRVGSLLHRQQRSSEIADLIRAGYGYGIVQVFLWQAPEQAFVLAAADVHIIPLAESGLPGEAWQRNAPVVVPVRLGNMVTGVLDLHSYWPIHHTRQAIDGLQSLADQLGIVMRNAELYNDALAAQRVAEKADQLKTRLLANASHELRAPLNIILGYSQTALATPNPYGVDLLPALLHDLQQLYRSGERLMRLINDLLDLSRAEIDELELFPEVLAPRSLLQQMFHDITSSIDIPPQVTYRLDLPEQLPALTADPIRLRQMLFNVLGNAFKFTQTGHVVLGADVAPPHLHVWVEDTGIGIAPNV